MNRLTNAQQGLSIPASPQSLLKTKDTTVIYFFSAQFSDAGKGADVAEMLSLIYLLCRNIFRLQETQHNKLSARKVTGCSVVIRGTNLG